MTGMLQKGEADVILADIPITSGIDIRQKLPDKNYRKKINRSATLLLTKGPVVNQKSLNILEIGLNSGQKLTQNILVVTFAQFKLN